MTDRKILAALVRTGELFRNCPIVDDGFPKLRDAFDIELRLASEHLKRLSLKHPSFSQRNKIRCESPAGFNHKLESWSLSDWITATTGELGEAANIVKKLNRVRDGIPGNAETPDELRAKLADEIADVAIYLDLLAQAAGFDLEAIREEKFAKTNAKIGYVEPENR